ncbi:MAG: hypothetical protein WCD86_03630 [Ktedonobacteraceae bacterium]
MQLVERTIISKNDPRYAVIDEAAFAVKNLYNLALYEWRQAWLVPCSNRTIYQCRLQWII